MTKAKDLRALSDEELNAKCQDFKKEVFQLRCHAMLRKDDLKPHKLKELRKNVARVLTIQSERQV